MYIISSNDERRFIKVTSKGKFIDVATKNKATKFDKAKAYNIWQNNLSGRGAVYKVVEFTEDIKKPMIEHIEDSSDFKIQPCVNKKISYNLEKFCEDLVVIPQKLENEKIRLNNQLIKVCMALTDISHYQEFNPKRSASQRCILEKLQSQILMKRRGIKNDLYYIELIEMRLSGQEIKEDNLLHNRDYHPRELNGLLEDNEIPKFEDWWNEIELENCENFIDK